MPTLLQKCAALSAALGLPSHLLDEQGAIGLIAAANAAMDVLLEEGVEGGEGVEAAGGEGGEGGAAAAGEDGAPASGGEGGDAAAGEGGDAGVGGAEGEE